MLELIDRTRNPRISAATGMLLASRLAKVAPMDEDQVRASVREMLAAHDDVDAVQQERERYQPDGIRTATQPMSAAFTSLHGALTSIATIPTGGARAKKAAALLAQVLPGGIGFVNADAPTAYHAAKRALDRALEPSVKEEIDALIGPEFIEAARRTTTSVGDLLGIGREPRRAPSSSALRQKLGRLSRTIGRYLRVLAARVDEDDPESVAEFMQLTEPVDAHRESMRKRGAADDDDPESDGADTDPAIPGGSPFVSEDPAPPTPTT